MRRRGTVTSSDGPRVDAIRASSNLLPSQPGQDIADEAIRDVRRLLRAFLGTSENLAGWKPLSSPEDLLRAAARLRVLPHIHSALEQSSVRAPWREEMSGLLVTVMKKRAATAMALQHYAGVVLRRMEAAGIPVIPFKGTFLSADVYGDALFRPGTDIDLLLVRGRADIQRALSALKDIGYTEPEHSPVVRDYLFSEKGQFDLVSDRMPALDIHYALYDDLPKNAREDAAARAVPVSGEQPRRLGLAHVDLLMVLAVHYWRHPGIDRMLSLVDFAMVCRDPEAFPEGWLGIVRAWRMPFHVAAGMAAAEHEFGVSPAGGSYERLLGLLPRRAKDLCARIRDAGPDDLPFGLVQRVHRLGLPWGQRLRAVRKYLWPHPGRLAEEEVLGRSSRRLATRLGLAWRRLLRAIHPS